MACEAHTYADGSWFCQKCGIGGDKDEPVEEFCHDRLNDRADRAEGEFHGAAIAEHEFYGTAHSHPADR